MKKKLNQEDRKIFIKRSYSKCKKYQANLELNYYIQKKILDFPNNYLEEIRKDIKAMEKFFTV